MELNPTELFQIVKDVGTQITSASPEILLGALSIVLGYAFKLTTWFPNRVIPSVVVLFTALVYPFMVTEATKASFQMKHPEVRLVVIGAVIGFVSWAVHYIFLKKWIDRFLPALNGNGNEAQQQGTNNPTPNP